MTRLANTQDEPFEIKLELSTSFFDLSALKNFIEQNPRILLFKKLKSKLFGKQQYTT